MIKTTVIGKCTIFILENKNKSIALVVKKTGNEAYKRCLEHLRMVMPGWENTKWTELKQMVEDDGSMAAYELGSLEILE